MFKIFRGKRSFDIFEVLVSKGKTKQENLNKNYVSCIEISQVTGERLCWHLFFGGLLFSF